MVADGGGGWWKLVEADDGGGWWKRVEADGGCEFFREKCYNASRFASVGYNANGGPKCQRRAKIPPSLKSLVVSGKIHHQTCTGHRYRHRPHPSPRHRRRQKNRQRRVKFLHPTLHTARRRQNAQQIVAKYKFIRQCNTSTTTYPAPIARCSPLCSSSQQLDNSSVPPWSCHRSRHRSPLRLVGPSCSSTNLEASRNGWTAEYVVALLTTARAMLDPVRDIL